MLLLLGFLFLLFFLITKATQVYNANAILYGLIEALSLLTSDDPSLQARV